VGSPTGAHRVRRSGRHAHWRSLGHRSAPRARFGWPANRLGVLGPLVRQLLSTIWERVGGGWDSAECKPLLADAPVSAFVTQHPDSIHRGCLERDQEMRTHETRDAEEGAGETPVGTLEALCQNGEVLEQGVDLICLIGSSTPVASVRCRGIGDGDLPAGLERSVWVSRRSGDRARNDTGTIPRPVALPGRESG
jgi:hypothetical protein